MTRPDMTPSEGQDEGEMAPKPRKPRADWEAIERDYRTGLFTGKALAAKHGGVVTHKAILNRANERGWTKAPPPPKPPPPPRPRKPRVDWEAIERDYRTGQFSGQELADKHGNVVARISISNRARRYGWTRDLSVAVRQATKARVIAEEVRRRLEPQVAAAVAGKAADSAEATTQAVLAAAELGAQVILRHRADAVRARDVAMGLLEELHTSSVGPEELRGLFELLQGDLDDAQLRGARRRFEDLVRLPSRIASAQKLADTLSKLQVLERRAFALDDEGAQRASGDDIWAAVARDPGDGD